MNEITVLYIEPLRQPRLVTIPHTLVHSDDAIAEGAKPNRVVEGGIVYGPFFLAGLGAEDFIDIPEELINKYTAQFASPEVFIPAGDHVAVIKIVSSPEVFT